MLFLQIFDLVENDRACVYVFADNSGGPLDLNESPVVEHSRELLVFDFLAHNLNALTAQVSRGDRNLAVAVETVPALSALAFTVFAAPARPLVPDLETLFASVELVVQRHADLDPVVVMLVRVDRLEPLLDLFTIDIKLGSQVRQVVWIYRTTGRRLASPPHSLPAAFLSPLLEESNQCSSLFFGQRRQILVRHVSYAYPADPAVLSVSVRVDTVSHELLTVGQNLDSVAATLLVLVLGRPDLSERRLSPVGHDALRLAADPDRSVAHVVAHPVNELVVQLLVVAVDVHGERSAAQHTHAPIGVTVS